MAMANIKVGQKLNGSMMIKLYGFIASQTVVELVRVRFWRPPHNLPCPSAFRVVWDGVTLRNGATVCIIMVVFTDYEGVIRSVVVDVPISRSGHGHALAAQIKESLDKALDLSTRRAIFRRTRGLPTRGAKPTLEGNRCGLLLCMNVDRAYSGKTGNKADLELAKALGIIGRRPGIADRIHCISGCGAKAWWKDSKATEKTGDPKAHCSSPAVRVDGDVGEREQCASGDEEGDLSSSASSSKSSSSTERSDTSSSDAGEKDVDGHEAREEHDAILPRHFKLILPWCIGPLDHKPLACTPLQPECCYFPATAERWTQSLACWSRVCSRLHKLFEEAITEGCGPDA